MQSEDIGLMPLGAEIDDASAEKSSAVQNENVEETAAKIDASEQNDDRLPKILWVTLISASMLMGAVASVVYAHLSVLYSSAGFDSGYIAAMISGIGLLLTLGKLLSDIWRTASADIKQV